MDGFDTFSSGCYDPGYSTYEAPPVDYGFHEVSFVEDDPMACALPAVVDAFAFDMSAPNGAVGFAMNEVARAQQFAYEQAQAYAAEALELCQRYDRQVVYRADGWPDLTSEQMVGMTRGEVYAYCLARHRYTDTQQAQ